MYERIVDLLQKNGARFRVLEHEAVGRSEEIARIRGNDINRSAKAMLLKITQKDKQVKHCLVVLPGNCKLNNKAVLKQLNAKSVSFEPDVEGLTGCVSGCVPPFTFSEQISLLVDDRIAKLPGGEIAFNAGALTRSIFLEIEDYLRITQPTVGQFSQEPTETSTLGIFREKEENEVIVSEKMAATHP